MELRKKLFGIGLATALTFMAPKCYVRTLQEIAGNCARSSPKIMNVRELNEKISEYKKELDIDDYLNIEGNFQDKFENITCRKDKDNYFILLNKDDANECSLRHEMYHIADGHLEEFHRIKHDPVLGTLAKWLIYEPQAILYQTLGWKL